MMNPTPSTHKTLTAIGYMVLASFLFSITSVAVKSLKKDLTLSEIVFYRAAIAGGILLIIALFKGYSFKTPHHLEHGLRGTFGSLAMGLNFFSNLALPMALAMTLSYMNPIFLALIICLWYKKPINRHILLCIILGAIGVYVLTNPTIGSSDLNMHGVIAGLLASLCAAVAYLNIQSMGKQGEPEWRIVFYGALITTAYAIISHYCIDTEWTLLTLRSGLWIGVLGISGLLGQLCLTKSYSLGDPNLVSIFSYTTLIFSALFGYLMFNEFLKMNAYIGGIIIVLSSVYAVMIRKRL